MSPKDVVRHAVKSEQLLEIYKLKPVIDLLDFYGKDGSYNVFAGKDCTRAVALWSKDPKDMTSDLVSCYGTPYSKNIDLVTVA